MATSQSLFRLQVAKRYGLSRTALYGWVDRGILPPADIVSAGKRTRGSRSFWSTTLLARWEKANASMLRRQGVYVDDLPPLNDDASHREKGRAKPSGKPQPESTSPSSVVSRYAPAILLLTQVTAVVAEAVGSSRVLRPTEVRKALVNLDEIRWRLRPLSQARHKKK